MNKVTGVIILAVLTAALLAMSCWGQQEGAEQSPAGQNNRQTSKSPGQPPPTSFINIVYSAAPGTNGYYGEFKPYEMHISPGTTVVWDNNENYLFATHIVTSKDGLFEKSLTYFESFNYTFTKPGTYTYYCKAFPIMTGKIVVE